MGYIKSLVAICVCVELVRGYCVLSDYERKHVPPVFAADAFSPCKHEGNLFCRMQFTLRPANNNTDSWRIIEKSINHRHCFNRDVVYRFRCLPNTLEDVGKLQLNATQSENNLLSNFSLKGHLDILKCNDYSRIDYLTTFDYVLMLALIGYMTTIALATISDFLSPLEKVKKGKTSLALFSIRSQWNNLKQPINNHDYNKMRCLQGVRTYTMALVITGHTISSALFSYVKDEKYIENFYVDLTTKAVVNGGLMLVQTNFMLSGLLHAKMVYSQVDKSGKLTFQFIIKKILLRYVRLFPTLAFVICLEMSNWTKVLVGPPPLESFDTDFDACQKNWWASLLLISNIFRSTDMCNMGLWYLTNDFQMYIISLLVFYVIFKFKVGAKMIIWVMSFFWFITFCLIYTYNMEVSYPYYASGNIIFTPINSKIYNKYDKYQNIIDNCSQSPLRFHRYSTWYLKTLATYSSYQFGYSMASYELYVLYTSLYINYGSYGVGLIFGYLLHRYRNRTFEFNTVVTGTWFLLFFGLPAIAVYGTLFEYSRLTSAILGPTLKPLFALGVAIGLFGMTHGLGGVIKKICEWDYAEFIARWSYSTYLIHFSVVFGRHLFNEGIEDISHYIMFKSAISDIIQSFIAGLVLHLIIERPMGYMCLGFLANKQPNDTEEECTKKSK